MPPLTPLVLTRLAPGHPMLLRDERTVQFGSNGGLHVSIDAEWVEPFLACLRSGFRRAGVDVIAHGVGAPRDEARRLVAFLEPLLVDDAPPRLRAWVDVEGVRDPRCGYRLREALADEAVPHGSRENPGDVAVVVLPGAAAAVQLAPFLRDDVAHLPIAIDRRSATIGPLVVPGRTPCLACRDGHLRDRDPAWPRLHAQMVGRDPGPVPAALIAGAGAAAATLLAPVDDDAGRIISLGRDGSRASTPVRFHEGCRCREPSSRSLPGTATEHAPRGLPTATSSPTTSVRRA